MSNTINGDIDDGLMASVVSWLRGLQDTICAALSEVDSGASFGEDVWERDTGGGGRTRILVDGNIFEQAFEDIWNGKKYIAAKKELLDQSNDLETICHACKKNGYYTI